MYLHPSVLPTICNLLDTRVSSSASVAKMRTKCHLSSVAAWADRERKRIRWSSPMHYVSAIGDDPPLDCKYSRTRSLDTTRRKGNVLDATRNFTRILAEWRGVNEVFDRQTYGPLKVGKPDEEAPIHNSWPNLPLPGQKEKEALKFLVHFLGDMHQPLHLTGKGRGGNDIKVQFEGRPTSLHSLWDGGLITKLSRAVRWNYTKPLYNSHASMLLPNSPTIEAALKGSPHHRWIRKILWEGIAHRWEAEVKSWLMCPGSYNRNSSWNGLLETTQLIFSLVFDPTQSKGGQIAEDGSLVCPKAWTETVHQLNCQVVWLHGPNSVVRPPEDQLLLDLGGPNYYGVIESGMIVEKLMAQAGLRLAGILNWLFKMPEGQSDSHHQQQ